MEQKYIYIGAINHTVPSDNFAQSLFTIAGTEDYFIHEQSHGKIAAFKKILVPNLIRKISEQEFFTLKIGDEFIYSFITCKNELFYGNNEKIEPSLLNLLKHGEINIHTKLLISSFLKLFSCTLEFFKDANYDLEKNGVRTKLNEDLAFNKPKRPFEVKFDFFDLLKQRYEKLHKVDSSIRLEDVAIINEDKVYLLDYSFDFVDIINNSTLSLQSTKKIVTKLINISYSKSRVDVSKLVNASEAIFEFLLESDNIIFNQKDVEKLLTSEIDKVKESIIDIGLQVDKELYENSDINIPIPESADIRSKESIINSFQIITGTISKKIKSW